MAEIIKGLEKEILHREAEKKLLGEIAEVTSLEFAERAAGELDPKKHLYSFEGYLTMLKDLKELLYVGMPENLVLESVQRRCDTETILEMYGLLQE